MTDVPCPAEDGSSPARRQFQKPPPMCIDPAKSYTAVMDTTMGSITIALDAAAAPRTVNNFVVLARYRYYEGVIFHRIIKGFVLPGRRPHRLGSGRPRLPLRGRTPPARQLRAGFAGHGQLGGPIPTAASSSSSAALTAPACRPLYSLFGKVTDGLDVVDAMQKVPTARNDRPLTPVTINSVTITESN